MQLDTTEFEGRSQLISVCATHLQHRGSAPTAGFKLHHRICVSQMNYQRFFAASELLLSEHTETLMSHRQTYLEAALRLPEF